MNDLQRHHLAYLMSQLENDDPGVELLLQHITGQELLNQPRPEKAENVREHIHNMRPIHVLLPATVLQIGVFVLAFINHDYFAPIFAAGNVSIIGLALIPVHIRQPKPLYHWV